MRNTNEKISMAFCKYSVNVQKEKNFIIVFVSPKCAHGKLAIFIVGMNLQYEPKDEEDCNNEGKSNQHISTYAPHTSFTHVCYCSSSCSAGSHKIITPQSIHVHHKQSKVMTKRRQAVAYEIITSSPYKKKTAKKERNEEEIKKKEEKAVERQARAEEKKKHVTATVTARK